MKRLLLLFIVISLLSCGRRESIVRQSTVEDSSEPITLELLVYANQGMMLNYETVLSRFNESHDDIKVKLNNVFGEDWTDYEQTLRSYILSGRVPDIVDISVIYRDSMIKEGMLMDLSPYVEKSGIDFDLYFDNQFEGLRQDGALYGIPSGAMLMAVFINKDLFREAGVKIPSTDWENTWTLDEFSDAASRISDISGKESDVYGFSMSYSIGWILPFLMGNGSSFLSVQSENCTAMENESLDIFEYLNTLMFEDHVSPGLMELINRQSYQYFMDGDLGITVDGNWWMEGFRDSIGFDWGVLPMPKGKSAATGMYVDFWAVPRTSNNGKEAFEVLRFFMEEEQQRSGIMKGIPLLKSSAYDIYKERFPDLSEEELQVWFRGIEYGHVPAYFNGWSEFQNLTTETFNNLALGNISFDLAMKQICDAYTNKQVNFTD